MTTTMSVVKTQFPIMSAPALYYFLALLKIPVCTIGVFFVLTQDHIGVEFLQFLVTLPISPAATLRRSISVMG